MSHAFAGIQVVQAARFVTVDNPRTKLLAANYLSHGVKPRVALQAALAVTNLRTMGYKVGVRIASGHVEAQLSTELVPGLFWRQHGFVEV